MCHGRDGKEEENRGCNEEVGQLLYGPISQEAHIPVLRLNMAVDQRETI